MTGAGDGGATLALALAGVLATAKIGGALASRLGQPEVLGEVLGGAALGALPLVGLPGAGWIADDAGIRALADLGVMLLLFEVGLESTIADMARVGASSAAVALVGVLAPFALGAACSAWLDPAADPRVHAFLGAALTATSVGITARVLADLGRTRSRAARVILGAAVLDDVLGLLALAAVTASIDASNRGAAVSPLALALIAGKAAAFLGVVLLARGAARRALAIVARASVRFGLLATSLALCFALAWAAQALGLAPILGAFGAGLVLEESHAAPFVDRGEPSLHRLVAPVAGVLAPVFFVRMGMSADLASLAAPRALALAGALVVAAAIGKLACALVAPGTARERAAVALGMLPRGEVGLVFASLGATTMLHGAPVVGREALAALVAVVVVTTLVTPPALSRALRGVPDGA